MAGLTRLELATFRVTGERSNQLSYSPLDIKRRGILAIPYQALLWSKKYGSSGRTRTCDLTINSRVLYQLSYRGMHNFNAKPAILLIYGHTNRSLGKGWWAMQDSNLRPPVCKTGALPTELIALISSQLMIKIVMQNIIKVKELLR